ncbi:MAG: DUF202 domain-containing protein [Candidatus Pacearchaeota archaeon]
MKRGYVQNELSEERTELSNERTLLSYIQTSLATFAFAFLLLKFSSEIPSYTYIGTFSLFLGAVFLVLGILQYKKRKDIIKRFKV